MRMIRFVMAGLLVAGLVVMAEAQQRGFGGGGPQWGPTQLIVVEVVQKDLKLSDEQIEKVKTWSEAQKAKAGEGKGAGKGGGNFKNMTKEERQELFEKMAAQAAESRKAAYKDLAGVLKPEQLARLKQIELQANGIQAFQSDETIAALMLTDSQKSKVKEIMTEFQKDRREVFGAGGGGGKGGFDKEKMAENQKKIDKLEKTAFGDIEESLTADQKKAWKELTGEPFDRSKLPLFAGFGGGGGNKGKNKAKD